MIRIETDEYRRSHAKSPRGWGLWLYTLTVPATADRQRIVYRFTGTYGATAKLARNAARAIGADRIVVMP